MKTYVMYTAFDYKSGKVTGGTRRFKEILYGLLSHGNIVHLFIPEQSDINEHVNLIRHNIKNNNNKYIPNGLLNFLTNFRTLKSIKKINYNAFIIVSVPYAVQLVLLRIKKISFIIWEDFVGYKAIQLESKGVSKFHKRIILKLLTIIERFTLKNVNKIIVQCNYDKEITLKRHNKYRKEFETKYRILFNNVNPSWIEKEKKLLEVRKLYKNESNYLNIIFIGNIDNKRKGLHLLIDAVSLLINKLYKVNLKIVGAGKLLDYYKNKYNEYSRNIIFVGYDDKPIKILIKSDIMVVPSLADSFPNTIMEALFFQVPVIGSNIGGIPEMLEFDELLFEPTVNGLYNKLKEILDNKNLLNKITKLCIRRNEILTFDWVKELEELL